MLFHVQKYNILFEMARIVVVFCLFYAVFLNKVYQAKSG